jgi:hypothetical protein
METAKETTNSEINNIAQFDLHLHLEKSFELQVVKQRKVCSLAVYNYLFLPLITFHFHDRA